MDSNWLQITAAHLRKLGHKRHSRLDNARRNRTTVDGFETLEDRMLLSANFVNSSALHVHGPAGVDVAFGVYTAAEIEALEAVPFNSSLSTKTPQSGIADGGHEPDVLTFVLDFKEAFQGNTTDGFGNVISSFDVTDYGFLAGDFDAVANAILAEVDDDYFAELVSTVAGPPGMDLAVDFIIGDIGVAPVGVSEYYYVQIGTGVSGPHTGGGILGVAGGSVVRDSSGGGPTAAVGDVVASVFTDVIVTLSGLTPTNALTSGNLVFTTFGIGGTLSHEIGHTVSLSHVDKALSVQPTFGLSPIMGTGAIDLPNQDRITEREFSLSGFDSQAGGAPVFHVQQLVDAIGLHTVPPPANIMIIETGGNTIVVEAGSTDTFHVVLDAAIISDILLTVVSGDTGEATVDKATLLFTPANWDVPQTVTVTGVDDQIRDGDQITTITVAFDVSPQINETVSVTTIDDETVRGTKDDDVFRFTVLPGGYQIQVNKVSYFLDNSVKREVGFQGLGGKDLIVITGAGGSERAVVRVGTVFVKSNRFSVSGTSMETIRVIAGTGNDRAKLFDSPGNDSLTGRPTFTSLTGKGFDNRVSGFDIVDAFATAGDAGGRGDRAALYDSSGNEKFVARPGVSVLSGKGFYNRATGFDHVDGYAKAGDAGGVGDRAYLYDSADNDLFYGRKTYSYITGTDFINVAYSFDKVYASATAGSASGPGDRAYLYDSAGNDTFISRPTKSILSGPGFYNQAKSFDNVYAYATAGGVDDRAHFYDSAGNDTFYGRPKSSYLTGSGFYNWAKGFDQVFAYSNAGGTRDHAYLYDSARNDTFISRPTNSSLSGPGYYNWVKNFDRVEAYASGNAGGVRDRAFLYDSKGNDNFFGLPDYSNLSGNGFYNRANGFDKVFAYASGDAGGVGDRAFVYDSAGKDTFVGRNDYGRLTGNGFLIFGKGFDRINAYANQGGIDTINNRTLAYRFFKYGSWEKIV